MRFGILVNSSMLKYKNLISHYSELHLSGSYGILFNYHYIICKVQLLLLFFYYVYILLFFIIIISSTLIKHTSFHKAVNILVRCNLI